MQIIVTLDLTLTGVPEEFLRCETMEWDIVTVSIGNVWAKAEILPWKWLIAVQSGRSIQGQSNNNNSPDWIYVLDCMENPVLKYQVVWCHLPNV